MATGIGQYGFGAKLARYAEAGALYSAITPTPGTGIVGHAAATTFDEEKAYIVLYNSGPNRIYPVSIAFHVTVVGASHTRVQYTLAIDEGNRRSSAGTALTINNCNMAFANASGGVAHIGAVVSTSASSARRVIAHVVMRGTIEVAEDTYEINFGGLGAGMVTGSRVATVAEFSRTVPPVVIGPGDSFLLHQWAASQGTGTTMQAVMTYIEA
jgi:hypothetical protein